MQDPASICSGRRGHTPTAFILTARAACLVPDLGLDKVEILSFRCGERNARPQRPTLCRWRLARPRHFAFQSARPLRLCHQRNRLHSDRFPCEAKRGELHEVQRFRRCLKANRSSPLTVRRNSSLIPPENSFTVPTAATTASCFTHRRPDRQTEARRTTPDSGQDPARFGIDPDGRGCWWAIRFR